MGYMIARRLRAVRKSCAGGIRYTAVAHGFIYLPHDIKAHKMFILLYLYFITGKRVQSVHEDNIAFGS